MHNIIRNNYTPHIGDYHNTIVHDNALNRVWFFDCDGVFESKTNIAVRNEGGESTTDAISQKFVTDNLNNINEDIDELEVGKQNKLVSGTNIKTINNQSVLGSGDIHIEGASDNYEDLNNLPKVNNTTLVGNKTSADLGLQSAFTVGANLSFSGNTLNAVDTTYIAGDNIIIENNVISATGGGSSYTLVNELDAESKVLSIGDFDFDTETGAMFGFIKNYDGDEVMSRNMTSYGLDDINLYFSKSLTIATPDESMILYADAEEKAVQLLTDNDATIGVSFIDTGIIALAGDSAIAIGDGEISIASDEVSMDGSHGWVRVEDDGPRIGSEGHDIVLDIDTGVTVGAAKAYYTRGKYGQYDDDDEIATVGYVNEHAGGGTPIGAGKGINIEEYALLSVTVEVSGQLPPDYMGTLPLTLNLSDIKPGTNMYDLFTEGKLDYEDLFYWDTMYEVTASGLDSEVVELAELTLGAYVLQFNGAGTTSGTVTATRGAESYTANVTVTITAGDNTAYISEGKHMLPLSLVEAAVGLNPGSRINDPEELLELFEGQDNVDAFIAAVKNEYKFYVNTGGDSNENLEFQTLSYDESDITILMLSNGGFDNAIVTIHFEDGEVLWMEKNAFIRTFTEDSDGLVPKPGYSQASSKYLRGNGTWQTLNTYTLTLTLEDDTTVTLNLKGE